MSQDVLFEQIGQTAVITLNRPEKLNAWTESMRNELIDHLEGLKGNEDIRVVILTGTGRAFCAGQDLAETTTMDPEDHAAAEAWIDGFDRLYRAVRNLDQITIAAVNGVAAGSGFQYALLADLRVGDSKVRMGQPEVLSGIPSITGIWAMWSILGKSKTSQFVLTGELVDATEAQRLGLLNYLADDGAVLDYAKDLANRLSLLPPGAVRLTKGRLRSLEEDDLSDAMAEAKRVHREAYGTGEPQREMARFLAGRKG
ncbi:enoyl-CoA hydratase/isomerase family protein [Arthrobacter cupressi]